MPQTISLTGPSCTTSPLRKVRNVAFLTSVPRTMPGPIGQNPSHPLDPQHGAGVGAAKIVRADVVGGREAGQKIPDLGRRDVSHRAAHDGGDLPLVVQPVAVGRPHQRPAVRVDRAHRLLEIGRGLAFEGSAELDRA